MIDPRITTAFEAEHNFPLEPHLLVLGLVGSHSHGTYIPPIEPNAIDDVDLMGFVVPPIDYHLGLPRWEHWTFKYAELDVVLYSLHKAFRLLLKSNPNILGLLWLRDEEYVHQDSNFHWLRANREIFSSQLTGQAFSGYALSQLKRMEAFDLDRITAYESLTATITAQGPLREVLEADAQKLKHIAANWGLSNELLTQFRKLHREHFSGYMGEKRKAMVRKYQYDVKNAAHLIRLLRMGNEFLRTGELQVYRTHDAEELKAIKRGEWSLEQVKAEAARLRSEVVESTLPQEPNSEAANSLLIGLHQNVLRDAASVSSSGLSYARAVALGRLPATLPHNTSPDIDMGSAR